MSAELQGRALQLRGEGLGYVRIGRALGVSATTARRYVKPGYREHDREISREAKRRRVGTCEDCGAETHYNGVDVNGASRYCLSCAARRNGKAKRGTGRRQLQLAGLLATRGPMRLTAIASVLGVTPNHAMVLLLREMDAGRVVRVRRGTYALSAAHRGEDLTPTGAAEAS